MTPPCVLAIHDLSGFGRGSLTTAIAVLSSMGMQVCPMPTSLLSTHTTGFENFSFLDLTEEMKKIIMHWKKLGLKFDAIYSGFLGSPEQAGLVEECIDAFSHKNTIVLIDPVLGDNGELYPTMDERMTSQMRSLIKKGHIITPNLTEAAILLGKEITSTPDQRELLQWARKLASLGPETVVITSALVDHARGGAYCEKPFIEKQNQTLHSTSAVISYQRPRAEKTQEKFWKTCCEYIPAYYPGTGDIFASVLTGSLIWKEALPVAIARAMRFIANGIKKSEFCNVPRRNGISLELVLDSLRGPISEVSSENILPSPFYE